MLVHLGRSADLLDPALVEHREAVAHRQRLLLVVRDVDEGDPELLLDPLQLDLQLLAQLQVERAERLVEQERLRPVHDRARERDALALAAGELRRLAAAVALEPDERERLAGAPPPLGARHLLHAEPVLDVLLHGHVREERVVLEDRVDVAGVRRQLRDVLAAELDRCPRPAARSPRSRAVSSSCRSRTARAS